MLKNNGLSKYCIHLVEIKKNNLKIHIMKKVVSLLAVVAFLFATNVNAQEKQDKKKAKAKTEKTCTASEKKSCAAGEKKSCCAAKK